MSSVPDTAFVVGFDRGELTQARAKLRRRRRLLLWSALLVGCTLIVTVGFAGQALLDTPRWPWIGWVVIALLLMLRQTYRAGIAEGELTHWNTTDELPAFAMRMTPQTLELGLEGVAAPVVVPWPAVAGIELRQARHPALLIRLAPGVTAASPGVSGLDHPAAAAALLPAGAPKSVGLYGLDWLDQDIQAIDAAVQGHSGGRLAVTQ